MRIVSIMVIGLLSTVAVATAADEMAPSENFEKRWDWTGIQFGLQAGYALTHDRITTGLCAFGPDFDCRAGGDDDVYGTFIGVNRHYGPLVVGAEVSYNHHANDFDDTSTVAILDTTSFTLRGGYAIDRVLPYGFVGTVYGRTSSEALGAPFNLPADWAGNDWGFTFGLGTDVAITEKFFAGFRYERSFWRNFNELGIDATLDTAVARIGVKF